MGELPGKRTRVVLKEGAELPQLPRFEKSAGVLPSATAATTTIAPGSSKTHPVAEAAPAIPSSQPVAELRQQSTTTPRNVAQHIKVGCRLGLTVENHEAANKVLSTINGKWSHLFSAIAKGMTITDRDFDEAGTPKPREALGEQILLVQIRVDREMFDRWSTKWDPFNVLRPGDVVRGAAFIAFNSAAKEYLRVAQK